MVALSGENHLNEYKNKDGQTIREVVLSVDKIEFLEKKSESNNSDSNEFLKVDESDMESLPFS